MIALGLLGGCQHIAADVNVCPKVPVWTPVDQQELSQELNTAAPMLRRATLELYDFRQEARACRKQLKK